MNAAIVKIDKKRLLEFLRFEGGAIHRAWIDSEVLLSSTVNLVIEHPDLPHLNEDDRLHVVCPEYHYYQTKVDGQTYERIVMK